MKDIWKEREKALENQYIHQEETKKIEKLKSVLKKQVFEEYGQNRCPKCSERLETFIWHGLPLDKCPGCGGMWLSAKDFHTIAVYGHRTWLERWLDEDQKE